MTVLAVIFAACIFALWRDQQTQRADRRHEAERLARQAERLHREQVGR